MTTTILLVVEHDFLRETLAMWLTRTFPKYQIKAVSTESEAIALALTDPPQLIVLDAGLPEAKSLDTIMDIKQALSMTPILVLTSYESELHHRHALARGASVCFRKDAILTALQPAIAALLAPPVEANGHKQNKAINEGVGQRWKL